MKEDLHRDPEAAAEMAANAVLKYLRECGIIGKREKQDWVARVFWMVSDRLGEPELTQ